MDDKKSQNREVPNNPPPTNEFDQVRNTEFVTESYKPDKDIQSRRSNDREK